MGLTGLHISIGDVRVYCAVHCNTVLVCVADWWWFDKEARMGRKREGEMSPGH